MIRVHQTNPVYQICMQTSTFISIYSIHFIDTGICSLYAQENTFTRMDIFFLSALINEEKVQVAYVIY